MSILSSFKFLGRIKRNETGITKLTSSLENVFNEQQPYKKANTAYYLPYILENYSFDRFNSITSRNLQTEYLI